MIHEIVRLSCRKPTPIVTIGNRLGLSERELRSIVADARSKGAIVEINGGHVFSRVRNLSADKPVVIGKVEEGRHHVAHVTDLHAGSKHFDRKALRDFLRMAKKRYGVRHVVDTGDNLDGNKPVLLPEQRAFGFDDQADELVEVVASESAGQGLEWVAIDGNHDGYLSNSVGFVSGKLLETRMREAGVAWNFAGVCLGRAVIRGAHWRMIHPHGAASSRNALRRMLNASAESLRERADIIVSGHFHRHVSIPIFEEHVFGSAGGTFQRQRSEFAQRITGEWDVGASIISYDVDKSGYVTNAAAEFFRY